MHLRIATAGDVDAVRAVAHHAIRATFALQPRLRAALLGARFGDDLEAELTDPGRLVVLAEVDAEVVGVAAGLVDEAVVEWLHVVPAHRDTGVGAALYERLRDDLESASGTSLTTHVLRENVAGSTFWERRGFRVVDRSLWTIDDERFVECKYTRADRDGEGGDVE